ncbi:ATP-dependent DNA helicase hus2/rqh1-like [Branchiostoma floridae]|uniref:DNA 3'-5' helicase n=1 Tax=Branchiostoma floridae TaxID=7739 RepID=A0A9J7MVS9_BRAFL|nr:ATP-dependent DNA helicase hus2/rqh1-like [Branchiostoma floridae]
MAATRSESEVDSAIASVLAELDGIPSLKPEQIEALKAFAGGKDVLAFLPPGFGKDLVYQIAPMVFEKLGRVNPIVIVLTPRVALIKEFQNTEHLQPVDLMEDKIREATKVGVKVAQLGGNDAEGIAKGEFPLVLGGPERWMLEDEWRDMLSSAVYRENLAGVVVDDAHLAYKWGRQSKYQSELRQAFYELPELRSLVKEGTPIMALTASADLQAVGRVRSILQLEEAHVVRASPNKRSVRLALVPFPDDMCKMESLDWIVDEVRDKGLDMECIIIYCRHLNAVGKVFSYLKHELGDDAWIGEEKISANMLIGIYHSATLAKLKDRVRRSLVGEGSCRVVVATAALGQGIDVKNVGKVVMYGPPEDMENILLMMSRAGCEGKEGQAVLYYKDEQLMKVDKAVKEFVEGNSGETCIRKRLVGHFEDTPVSVQPGHKCCTSCHGTCKCAGDDCSMSCSLSEKLFNKSEFNWPGQTREVDEEQQELLRELLLEYQASLHPNVPLFLPAQCYHLFTDELIDAVVEHCAHIFTLEDVNKLPVFRQAHAKEILLIISEVFNDIPHPGFETELDAESEQSKEKASFDCYYTGYFDGPSSGESENDDIFFEPDSDSEEES